MLPDQDGDGVGDLLFGLSVELLVFRKLYVLRHARLLGGGRESVKRSDNGLCSAVL